MTNLVLQQHQHLMCASLLWRSQHKGFSHKAKSFRANVDARWSYAPLVDVVVSVHACVRTGRRCLRRDDNDHIHVHTHSPTHSRHSPPTQRPVVVDICELKKSHDKASRNLTNVFNFKKCTFKNTLNNWAFWHFRKLKNSTLSCEASTTDVFTVFCKPVKSLGCWSVVPLRLKLV